MSTTNVARAGKRGNICVGNNVSSFARAFSQTVHCKDISMVFARMILNNKPKESSSYSDKVKLEMN